MRRAPLLAAVVLWVAVSRACCDPFRQLAFTPVLTGTAAGRRCRVAPTGSVRMQSGLVRVVGAVVLRDGLVFMAQRPEDKVDTAKMHLSM